VVEVTTTVGYGPGAINCHDIEGDAVSPVFSVVSQPVGANVIFTGTSATGLTEAGTYTFRYTCGTGTFDFTQLSVSNARPSQAPVR
jgi:hypothetical protein